MEQGLPGRAPHSPAAGGARLRIEPLSGAYGLRISGDLDVAGHAAMTAALAALDGAGDVRLDLGELRFADTRAAGLLVHAARALGPGRHLVLRDPPYELLRVIEVAWGWPEAMRVDQ